MLFAACLTCCCLTCDALLLLVTFCTMVNFACFSLGTILKGFCVAKFGVCNASR